MGKRDSLEYPYCKADYSDIPHILFNCSFFEHLRDNALSSVARAGTWPSCYRTCLLYPHDLPDDAKAQWPEIECWASRTFLLVVPYGEAPQLIRETGLGVEYVERICSICCAHSFCFGRRGGLLIPLFEKMASAPGTSLPALCC